MVDGEDKVAPLLEDGEWEALKSAVSRKEKFVTMPCCNAAGRLRVSKLGTKHFYHGQTAECDWKPETAEHLRIKSEILVACKKAGYDASPEKVGPDWRADVYAEKGKSKVAFEAQWSRQTLDETEERQEKYRRDSVKGCWFFRKPPFEDDFLFKANNDLPIFKLSGGKAVGEPFLVTAPALFSPANSQLTPQDFVILLLERRLRFRSSMTPSYIQPIKVAFIPQECYKCGKTSHVFYVEEPYNSRCGKQMKDKLFSPLEDNAEALSYGFRPEIVSAVRHYLVSNPQKQLKVGDIKPRYSNIEKKSYTSFGCYYCDSISGNFYVRCDVREASLHSSFSAAFEVEVNVEEPFSESYPHWCYPEDGTFCNASQSA